MITTKRRKFNSHEKNADTQNNKVDNLLWWTVNEASVMHFWRERDCMILLLKFASESQLQCKSQDFIPFWLVEHPVGN